jgi:ketosteroid isomerase-like protein
MRLSSLPGNLLAYMILLLIAAYYLGTRRFSADPPRSNKGIGGFLKVGLLVCLSCIVIAVLVLKAADWPNHRASPPLSIYVSSPDRTNDNAATLEQLEAEFMKAAAEKGSQGYMSYYADDAVELPNGATILQGKDNIAKTMGFLDNKDNHLTWAPVGADISASGDLGYTYGTYEFRATDKDGKPIVDHGKYTSIWKKQKDGKWKVVLDMGNATPEAGK